MNNAPLFLLNIVMAIGIVILFLSGNIGLGFIALVAGALIALKLNRRPYRARRNAPR